MGKGFGITGFILSLLSIISLFLSLGLISSLVSSIFALIFGILGLIFCIIQLKKERTGLAIAGLVISIIGIAIGAFNIVSSIIVGNSAENTLNAGEKQIEDMSNNFNNLP